MRVRPGGNRGSGCTRGASRPSRRSRCAVQRDLDRLVGRRRPAARSPPPRAPTRNSYSASSGNMCSTTKPPRVPSGQPFAVLGLRQPARRRVGRAICAVIVGIADGEAADLCGGRDVRLHQRRRHAEHVGDVVEAVARVVARQQRRGVDRQIEQVADGVGVFGAVQAMQRRCARIRARRRPRDRARLPRRRQGVERGAVRPRRAARRHHARAHLAHDLLPYLRLLLAAAPTSSWSSRRPPALHSCVVAGDAVAIYTTAPRVRLWP